MFTFDAGGEKIRQFWKHYYKGTQAMIYMIDSACSEEDFETNKKALQEVLAHPDVEGLPCLILANCQDKEKARPVQEVSVRQKMIEMVVATNEGMINLALKGVGLNIVMTINWPSYAAVFGLLKYVVLLRAHI